MCSRFITSVSIPFAHQSWASLSHFISWTKQTQHRTKVRNRGYRNRDSKAVLLHWPWPFGLCFKLSFVWNTKQMAAVLSLGMRCRYLVRIRNFLYPICFCRIKSSLDTSVINIKSEVAFLGAEAGSFASSFVLHNRLSQERTTAKLRLQFRIKH